LPPNVPKERVDTLRNAFAATMGDAEFIAESRRSNIIINATPGEELEEIVSGFAKLPSGVLTELKKILLSNN
jgi:hypothetical protein